MSQPLLEVKDLHVRYGNLEVLKGVGLRVNEGEIVALIGANGAGKTTTLMAISGLAAVSGGSVRFLGMPLVGLPPEQVVSKGVTQVPEGRRVFARMTVLENILIGAGGRKPEGREIDRMFALFPVLKQRQEQFAGTLSGGEQQMLAIARGLMARPRLLLLDEPSLGLAPKLVMQLFEVIRGIHKEGITILLVEQNAYQALRVAQRAYVLETGKTVLEGSAKQLQENPDVKKAYLGG
jgi:branched-chain amino acid transport system ATP-binding protein